MSNDRLTREKLDDIRFLYEEERTAIRAMLAERDQFAASLDIFKGRIQALEMERDALQSTSRSHKLMREAQAERDEARERVKVLERLLRMTQSLLDDVDQGPRAENSSEWRIPWTRHAVEVFSQIAAALSPTTDGAPHPSSIEGTLARASYSEPVCSKCSQRLKRGPIGGGHFDWLECDCSDGAPKLEKP